MGHCVAYHLSDMTLQFCVPRVPIRVQNLQLEPASQVVKVNFNAVERERSRWLGEAFLKSHIELIAIYQFSLIRPRNFRVFRLRKYSHLLAFPLKKKVCFAIALRDEFRELQL